MGWLIGGVAFVVALLVWGRRKYGRVFADDHFIEIGRVVAGLKAAAVAQVIGAGGDEPASPADPRIHVTAAGLAIIYTVRHAESGFVHHWSVGFAGDVTGHAAGATFVIVVARLVGLPLDRAAFEVAASTVHHGEVILDQAEHDELVARPVPRVEAADVAELKRSALDARAGLRWARSPRSRAAVDEVAQA